MMDDHTSPMPAPLDRRMAGAVRETFRRQVIDLLNERGLSSSPDLRECPRCGDRTILLEQPATFGLDPATHGPICAACRAEQDFLEIVAPDVVDIGGEGG